MGLELRFISAITLAMFCQNIRHAVKHFPSMLSIKATIHEYVTNFEVTRFIIIQIA